MRIRLHADHTSAAFSNNVLQLCEGTMIVDDRGDIEISSLCIAVSTASDLREAIFPDISDNYQILSIYVKEPF